MKVKHFPTEKIFADAWSIANSKLYIEDRRRYRSRMDTSLYMFAKYGEDIERVEKLLADKLDRWAKEHKGSWTQYIADHPRNNRIEEYLENAR
jgi:hypothetical protein